MENFLGLFNKKPKVSIRKKVTLIPVPTQQFEDLTLTKEFLEYLEDQLARSTEALASGAWEDETQARELVGQIRAFHAVKTKYGQLYKALYNR